MLIEALKHVGVCMMSMSLGSTGRDVMKAVAVLMLSLILRKMSSRPVASGGLRQHGRCLYKLSHRRSRHVVILLMV